MKKFFVLFTMILAPQVFAATLTSNTIPYVCQGGTNPQLCNSMLSTDSSGNLTTPTFIPQNIQVFTSSGTWVKPANVSRVYVKVIGAGGNGAPAFGNCGGRGCIYFSGGGGGGGGYAEGIITVSGNVTVTIGATNAFNASGGTIQATAGGNGNKNQGGAGGVGSGGAINITGSSGGMGVAAIGGPGGGTVMGSGGMLGNNGGSYGGGGSGENNDGSDSAGNGDPGAVIVYY